MPSENLHPSLTLDQYLFRKKVFKLAGGAFHVYDKSENVVLFSEMKAFKLKEDIRIYADESKSEELLVIKTPQILDIAATYYVDDPKTGERVGALRRKGLKSILKDEWLILSPDDQEIGIITESSLFMALMTRFIKWLPQNYDVKTSQGGDVADIQQHFNPFVLKYTMHVIQPEPEIDRRLLVVAGILLSAIEGRQD